MAATRRSRPAERGRDALEAAADRALAALAGARIAVALSGGRDSTALLHACATAARRHDVRLSAIHVHHGLSAHADAWSVACERLAGRVGVPLVVERVSVLGADELGVEAAARRARKAALRDAARAHAVDAIALAHHRDDQAETLLLQALRGAGPHGLAAMPAQRRDGDGLAWLRPFLDVPRAAIETYVARHALAYVDDDSNSATRHRRNALRLDVMPALARSFPAAPATLARAAALQAEAAGLLDELAALDAGRAVREGTLDCAALGALPGPRARNLLRWFLRGHGLRAPSRARLAAMLGQLAAPRTDARIRLEHAGATLGVHRGRIHVHAPAPPRYEVAWHGERELRLPHGRLVFVATTGEGLGCERVARRAVAIAPRRGGERLALDPQRPRRGLAAWLHDAGVPHWEREALPLVFCDGELAAVPLLGADLAWRAGPGESGWHLDWRPEPPAASPDR